MDIVDRLREAIITDAFEAGRIKSGVLAERLMKERIDAAAEIKRLRGELAIWRRGPTSRRPPIPLTVTEHTLKEGWR